MTRPPTLPFDIDKLPTSERPRREFLQDIFGACLMWNRSQVMELAEKRITSAAARAELGTIFRRAYENVAALGDSERAAALKLAEQCVDNFAIFMLALLAGNGVDLKLQSGQAIRFPLDIEVLDVESRNVILHQRIGAGAGFLPDNWGRWLNRNPFGRHAPGSRHESHDPPSASTT